MDGSKIPRYLGVNDQKNNGQALKFNQKLAIVP
jgi:hypothetical protein